MYVFLTLLDYMRQLSSAHSVSCVKKVCLQPHVRIVEYFGLWNIFYMLFVLMVECFASFQTFALGHKCTLFLWLIVLIFVLYI